jgi:ABC-type glycerol-3-phosphate transport system substrate-binding protein
MSKKKNSYRKLFRATTIVCVGLMIAGLVLAGCSTATPTPEVVTVVETVVVEKEVEGETVTVVETVEVEKIVEVLVTEEPEEEVEQVPIVFLSQETDPLSVEIFRQAIKDFEAENPDIRIELQFAGPDQIVETMVAALTAGASSLDVFQPNPAVGLLLGAEGQLLPLNDMVEEMGGNEYFLGGNEFLRVGDEIYGVPFGGGLSIIWYRQDLFEQEGIEVPQTLEEFEAAAEHFTREFNPDSPTEFGLTLPLANHGSTWLFGSPFLYGFGGEVFDEDLNVVFDSPETVAAVEWYTNMAQYTSEAAVGYAWGDMIDTFLTEQSAMTFYLGRTLGRVYANAPDLVGKVGVFHYPTDGIKATVSDPSYYAINANTEYPEQAQRWIKYLLSPEVSGEVFCTIPTHILPSNQDQLDWWNQDVTGCDMLDENPDIKNAFAEYLPYAYNPIVNAGGILKAYQEGGDRFAFTGSANPLYSAPGWPFADAVQRVIVDGISPADAVKAVAEEAALIVEQQKAEIGWGE